MARIEVRRLRYRGEPARAARVESAVVDALRTEVIDDGRLVLVRSFRLGRIGLAERDAAHAAASAWRAIRDQARHGGASGAESANCVWFADAAEARMLLMRELASGRTPFAWFWVLAVPDWRRETLGQWLGRRLDEAVRDPSGETAATLVAEALAAGCVEPLAAAILARIPPVRVGETAREAGEEAVDDDAVLQARASQAVEDAAVQGVALAIARSIPPALRTILATTAARPELAVFVEALARGLILRLHPALALGPLRLALTAVALVRILRFGETPARGAPCPSRTEVRKGCAAPDAAPDGPPPAIDRRRPPALVPTPAPASIEPVAPSLPAEQPAAIADPLPVELSSVAAGLFLAIVPLIRLGWREWLAERPHLLLHQPGPRLLQRIAAHYHVAPADPLWGLLPPVDPADEPSPELEDALRLWRAGLDGWLRRKARLHLAGLVLRRGWILPGVETTLVRFPLQAIEIGLRRLALDGDPGWVDWLGHSYRLVYHDRPLLGADFA